MTKTVFAIYQEQKIIFTYNELGDVWECTIPRSMNGSYYLDVYVEDENGNIGFVSKALFEVDPFALKYSIKFLNYDMNRESDTKYDCTLQQLFDIDMKLQLLDDIHINLVDTNYLFVCKEEVI